MAVGKQFISTNGDATTPTKPGGIIHPEVLQPSTIEPSNGGSGGPGGGGDEVITTQSNQPASYTPNPEGYHNTGGGAEAAVGTDYSWNKQGSEKAQRTYSSDVLTANQNSLTNRQTIENNAVNYQAQADMMQYQNNQNAEKVGWTGGYVLDQNRQMDYLKASIQAQMYGAMELQKYGHDSALAAARLSYDLNQQEYARQYYQDAISSALSEAQLTGVYFSAETRDMLSQRATAQQILKDPQVSDADRERAQKVITSINGWFKENNVSESGVEQYTKWATESQEALTWEQQQFQEFDAALKVAQTNVADNVTAHIRYTLDENGNPKIEYTGGYDGEVRTLDMDGMSAADLVSYIKQQYTGADGKPVEKVNTMAREQVQSYINYLYEDAKNKASTITKDKDGNEKVTTNLNKKEYKEAIEKLETLLNEINGKLEDNYKLTNPIKATDKPLSNGNGVTDVKEDYDSIGEWNQDTTIVVNGDNGEHAISLSNLSYLDWNDPNGKLNEENKKQYPKASLDIGWSDLPSDWQKVFKDQLKINDSSGFLIETLPITVSFKTETNQVKAVVNGIDKSITQNAVPGTIKGLGGQIESFLKDFYLKTTGKESIDQGTAMIVGNNILVWMGDKANPKWQTIVTNKTRVNPIGTGPGNYMTDESIAYLLSL